MQNYTSFFLSLTARRMIYSSGALFFVELLPSTFSQGQPGFKAEKYIKNWRSNFKPLPFVWIKMQLWSTSDISRHLISETFVAPKYAWGDTKMIQQAITGVLYKMTTITQVWHSRLLTVNSEWFTIYHDKMWTFA